MDIFLRAISLEISSKLLNGLSATIHFTQLNTVERVISGDLLYYTYKLSGYLSAMRLLKRSEATAPILLPQMTNYLMFFCL